MHLGDSIFIFILALVLLGPKKTSELARQLGKLMGEFRKASNDFKYQFNEEMRVADQQEQQRKQEAERAALSAGQPVPPAPPSSAPAAAAEAVPYAVSATTGEEQPVEDHPLLRVDTIPPMNGTNGRVILMEELEQGATKEAATPLAREEEKTPVGNG